MEFRIGQLRLLRFSIDEEICKGCGVCLKDCPTSAISGEKKSPHRIDERVCVQCGVCYEECPFDAVKAN